MKKIYSKFFAEIWTLFTKLSFIVIFSLFGVLSQAQVTVIPATGGIGISADKAANATAPLFTTLGDIVITEGATGDFPITGGTQTLILTAPAGWAFNAGTGSISVGGSVDFSAVSITVTTTTITIDMDVTGTAVNDIMTISGIEARASDGAAIPSSGQVYNATTNSGSVTVAGITPTSNTDGSGGTNFGNLSQIPGGAKMLAFMTQPGGAIYGTVIGAASIITRDQFNNASTAGLAANVIVTAAIVSGTGSLTGTLAQDIGTGSGN